MKLHRTFLFLACALVSFLGFAGCTASKFSQTRWTALFNGKDLSGWVVKCQPRDQGKAFWRVENGAILCDSVGRKDHSFTSGC